MHVRLRDGSGTRDYRYVVEDVDRHGNIRRYFNRRGHPPKIRLFEIPGTPAFDKEYERAFRGELNRPLQPRQAVCAISGSMRWLCEQYYASASFQSLGSTTRKVRRRILDTICERLIESKPAGDLPFEAMEPRHVAKLRDEKKQPCREPPMPASRRCGNSSDGRARTNIATRQRTRRAILHISRARTPTASGLGRKRMLRNTRPDTRSARRRGSRSICYSTLACGALTS
jgi:hypothetical protein